MIVLLEQLIDDGLGLLGRSEPLGVEILALQRAVETLVVAVIPR